MSGRVALHSVSTGGFSAADGVAAEEPRPQLLSAAADATSSAGALYSMLAVGWLGHWSSAEGCCLWRTWI